MVDILGVNILGVDILGVDILGRTQSGGLLQGHIMLIAKEEVGMAMLIIRVGILKHQSN